MNNNLWKILKEQLDPYALSVDEKVRVRSSLQSYILKHPVSRVSPYLSLFFVRPLAGVMAVLLVLVGGGAGLSFASQDALPNEILYPVKILNEEIVLWSKSGSEEKARYEIERVDKRFTEAAELAKKNQLDSGIKAKIAEKLTEHIASIKASTAAIEKTDPNSAMETNTKLGVSLEINSHVLASVAPEQKNENPILAIATDAVQKIAEGKTEVSKAVTLEKDSIAQTEATEKLAKLRKEVASLTSLIDTDSKDAEEVVVPTENPDAVLTPTKEPVTASGMTATTTTVLAKKITTEPATLTVQNIAPKTLSIAATLSTENEQPLEITPTEKPSEKSAVQKSFIADLSMLLEDAESKIAAGEYGAALVIMDQVEEKIETQKKISSLEESLDVEIPEKILDIPTVKESTSSEAEASAIPAPSPVATTTGA